MKIQKAVGVSADGLYGNRTKEAVAVWQRAHGLTADGIVGYKTWVAMFGDDMPTKALVNIQGSFPAGSTLQVWICNNGNDAEPTWEDITSKILAGQKHFFTNQTKTAENWGVKLKVKLLRGPAEGACYPQHHPKATFRDDAVLVSTAAYVHVAI